MRATRLATLSTVAFLAACDGGSTSPKAQELVDYFLNYCSSPPAWVAVQAQSGGPWTQVTLDGTGKASVPLGDKFGLAVVRQNSATSWSTYVYFVTKTELPSTPTCTAPTGSKTLNGSVSTLTSGLESQVSMDGKSAFNFAGGASTFSLTGVTDGAKDVFGQRRVSSTGLADKVILRRAQDVTGGTTMTQFNFTGVEAVTPTSATATLAGVSASDVRSVYATLYTSGGLYAFFNSPSATNTSGTVYGLPAASGASTDRHVISLFVHSSDYTTEHGVDVFQQALANLTITSGAALSTPTVTVPSTSPKRLRFQWASQADYGAVGDVYYWSTSGGIARSVSIVQTAAYLGGTPATWDIEPPVLTAVTGYPVAADMPNATAMWSIQSVSTTAWYFHNATELADGTVVKWAWQESSVAVEPPGQLIAGDLRSAQQMPRARGRGTTPW